MRLVIIVGVLSVLSSALFAESAPVYDVDALPSQYESSAPAASPENAEVPLAEQSTNQEGPGSAVPFADSGSTQNQMTFVPEENFAAPRHEKPTVRVAPRYPMTMEQRVKRVEQQVVNLQDNDSATRVDSLQNQVQSLRSQVDVLTKQLKQAEADKAALIADFDKRLNDLAISAKSKSQVAKVTPATVNSDTHPGMAALTEGSTLPKTVTTRKTKKNLLAKKAKNPVAETIVPTSTGGDQPNVAEEQQIYQTAYTLIKAKKYNEAVSALQNMLRKYPSGQFASNAHYWLGELFGLMGKNEEALNEFNIVVKNYPNSPRISDAHLKVGLIYAALLKWPEAKISLKAVINHYPGTASARLASEQLHQIKLAGH